MAVKVADQTHSVDNAKSQIKAAKDAIIRPNVALSSKLRIEGRYRTFRGY